MIHLLATEGSKSPLELKRKFPMFSEATVNRDIKLLKKTGLIVEKRESRVVGEINTRKVFVFFGDHKDVTGKTRKAMERLKRGYTQVTLELIASYAGLPPKKVKREAYRLAPELGLPIGRRKSVRLRDRAHAYGPKAEFVAIPETARIGESTKFDASHSLSGWDGTREVPITKYGWDFGDGNKTTETSPTVCHVFQSPRKYYVVLTVYALGATPEDNSITQCVRVLPIHL